VIPGETIASGGPETCPDCGKTPTLGIYRSNAGYYIGTYCDCGPYSRESGYYSTREKSNEAFEQGGYER